MSIRVLTIAISICLLFFLTVPLSFVAYGVLGGGLGGMLLLGGLFLLQWPVFALLSHFGVGCPKSTDGR